MKKDSENIVSRRFASTTFEIACFSHRESGFDVDIWLNCQCESKRKHNHLPRVKLVLPNRSTGIIVSISSPCKVLHEPPKISTIKLAKLKKAMPFISQNTDILLKHWNGELTDCQALLGLRRRRKNPSMPYDEVMQRADEIME